MDLTLLEYIVTIAEERKLSKAAEKLYVTSSALSQCVKKLETDLGVPLFERINGYYLHLTNGGKIYVDAAKKILQIKKEAYMELEDLQHAKRGRFVFGCSPKRRLAMFANVYPVFHKAYPKLGTAPPGMVDGSGANNIYNFPCGPIPEKIKAFEQFAN